MHHLYAMHMRTTISLDDRLAEQVRRRAAREGSSVSAFIARVLGDALKQQARAAAPPPFRLVTVKGDGTCSGVDLDRPRTLDTADDEALYGARGTRA